MIDSEIKTKTKAITLILSLILLVGASHVLSADGTKQNSAIETSTGQLVFEGKTTSMTFNVWNEGTGILIYGVSVVDGAEYFTVEPEEGQSQGPADQQTHTVTVDYNDVHGETVVGMIEITSDEGDSVWIDLSATESIASRVFRIEIEQSIDYGALTEDDIPGIAWETFCDVLGLRGDFDCDGRVDFVDLCVFARQWRHSGSNVRADISPDCGNNIVDFEDLAVFCENWLKESKAGVTYDFRLNVETDDTVEDVEFITPAGNLCCISDEEYTQDGHIETRHSVSDGIHSWTYQEWFYEAEDLAYYGEGEYTVIVYYTDGETDETIVRFGIPQKPGAIAQPTQKPILTNPLSGEQLVSPVWFGWEKCSDSTAGAIRLNYRNRCNNNRTEKVFGRSTNKTNAYNLGIGKWLAELSFGRWYKATNDDGIEIEVGKCSRSQSVFETMKWFGTFGGKKNYPLKTTDCNEREVTFNLTGGGFGQIEGSCFFERIILADTTEKSVFRITTKKGAETNVGDITVEGPIKSIIGRGINLQGNIQIDGDTRMIALNDLLGNREITIGQPASPKTTCSLRFGRVNDLALTSQTPVRYLRATEWQTGLLEAPWISTMKITGSPSIGIAGDFGADLSLSGDGSPKNVVLKKAYIKGEIGGEWGAFWDISGDCGPITFASSTPEFTADIKGSIRQLKAVGNKKLAMPSVLSGVWNFESALTIKADDINQCSITAGPTVSEKDSAEVIRNIMAKSWIKDTTIETTTGSIRRIKTGGLEDSDFSIDGSLDRLDVKGLMDIYCFINTNVEAEHIGAAKLMYPKYSNIIDGEHIPFGLTAGSIDKLTLTLEDTHKKKTWKNIDAGVEWTPIGDFIINLQ